MTTTSFPRLPLSALFAVLVLATTGCFGGEDPDEDDDATTGLGGSAAADDGPPEEPDPEFLTGWEWAPEHAAVEFTFPLLADVDEPQTVEEGEITLTVESVRFGDDRIDARLTVENRGGHPRTILAGGLAAENRSLLLEDDLGNAYPYSPAFSDDRFEVPPGTSSSTRATFIGRIHPEATSLTLTTNGHLEPGGATTTLPVVSVTIDLEPLDPDGELVGVQGQHPGRSTIRVLGVELGEDHTVVTVAAAGRSWIDFELALAATNMGHNGLHLVDAGGNTFSVVRPVDNDGIRLDAAKAHPVDLVFAGRVDPADGPFTLITNAGYYYNESGNGLRANTSTPSIAIEGIEAPEAASPPARTTHPTFLTATVRGLQVWTTHVGVDLEIVSGNDRELVLDREPVLLRSEDGEEWEATNTDLDRLTPFTTTRTTLVFEGDFTDVPDTFDLAINAERGSDDGGSAQNPRIVLEAIPTSGAGTAITADNPSEASFDVTDLPTSVVGEGIELVSDEAVIADILDDLDADTTEDITVTLADEVLFDFDSDVLTEPGRRLIAEVAEVIGYYDDAPVRIEGHTDSHGDPAYNQRLSERRAAAVVAALTSDHDIDPGRLQSQGFGETQPVAPNSNPDGSDNPEGRQQNRRVEIIIEADPDDIPGDDEDQD